MSPCQKMTLNKNDSSKVLLSRGLAIVLKRTVVQSKKSSRKKNRKTRKESDHQCKGCEEIAEYEFGPEVFLDWTRENEECFWNPSLVQSVKSLEYKGFVRPTTLLVGGTDYSLEVVRSAWGRRMLRPPHGYDIIMLGDLDPVTMNLVSQTQFAPLPEALCKVVYDLTTEGLVASMPVITKKLKNSFPELMVPSEDILCRTLGTLIRERKLFHTGSGYAVVTPDTFRLLAMSPPLERQMLLTNEEAIVRLHGTTYTVDDGRTTCTQTQQQEILTAWSSAERILEPRKQGITAGKLKRCHSLKLLRGRDKEKLSRSNSFKSTGTSPGPIQDFRNDAESIDAIKKEKSSSMFSKWFRRGRVEKNRTKSKSTSSSTQFPPRDWSDPDYVLYNSRATQTMERTEHRAKSRSSSLNRTFSNKDRHSQNLSSTPATPRASHRNSQRHSNDFHRHRSSSLSRKPSPSPKREIPTPQCSSSRIGHSVAQPKPQEDQINTRPRYESPFSPFVDRRQTQSQLLASEKYNNFQNGIPSLLNGKVTPYQSTDIIKSQGIIGKPPTFTPTLLKKPDPTIGWKRPTSWVSSLTTPSSFNDEPIKQQPSVRVIPRFTSTPKEAPHLQQTPKTQTTTKTIVDSLKTSETVTETFPNTGKEIRLGTTVDVEISVGSNNTRNLQNNKTLLTTDLDNPRKNDLLKIATTYNQSIKSSNGVKMSDFSNKPNATGIPKLMATTNITTSVSHSKGNHQHDGNKIGDLNLENIKGSPLLKRTTVLDFNGRDSPSKDTISSSSPRSTMNSDAKSEFFSESPNTTTEVHLGKEDSGFSSSTSTSRPMSVSPC